MPVTYEFWLSDDRGRRIALLKNIAFASYTRAVAGLGTLQVGLPFRPFASQFNPYFSPDWRVEVWRSAAYGVPMRNEDVFMLRKPQIYMRAQDGMEMIVFYGRNGIDLLKRRSIIQLPGTSYTEKTDLIDDMMKAIVREQMLYGSALDKSGTVDNDRAWPQGEFTVQGDVSLGASVTRSFAGRNVYDVLKDLRNSSMQLNLTDPEIYRIYFDVVPIWLNTQNLASAALQGWEFRTYINLRGGDRTLGIEFSAEHENIHAPEYSISYLDEVNSVIVTGNGRGSSQVSETVTDTIRVGASRWNRVEKVISASNEASAAGLQNVGYGELGKGRPKEELNVTFLNTEGGSNTPRSLYGLDWDLGDKVRVNVARKQFHAEVGIVYVAVDEQGKENITARNVINEQ